MKTRIIITLLALGITSFAQDAKKMAKNLTIVTTSEYDKTFSISFDRKNPEKHGFDNISEIFRVAFVANGFTVKENPQYLLVMDYDYGYVIAAYRFQYSNLTAQILDLNNNRTVVATIVYNGRFEINSLAGGVAQKLSQTEVIKTSTTTKTETTDNPVSKTIPAARSKEERLTELKQLYEKQLITKEEYDESRKKILAE